MVPSAIQNCMCAWIKNGYWRYMTMAESMTLSVILLNYYKSTTQNRYNDNGVRWKYFTNHVDCDLHGDIFLQCLVIISPLFQTFLHGIKYITRKLTIPCAKLIKYGQYHRLMGILWSRYHLRHESISRQFQNDLSKGSSTSIRAEALF